MSTKSYFLKSHIEYTEFSIKLAPFVIFLLKNVKKFTKSTISDIRELMMNAGMTIGSLNLLILK